MSNAKSHRARQGARPAPATNVPPELIEQIKAAVAGEAAAEKARDEAQNDVMTACEELESRKKGLGAACEELRSRRKRLSDLLLEAKAILTTEKTFLAFAKDFCGLQKGRVNELLRIVRGTTTEEEVKAKTRKRVAEHRSKKKMAVTSDHVTAKDAKPAQSEQAPEKVEFDPEKIEDPSIVKKNIIFQIERQTAWANAFRKISKVSTFDREAKVEIGAAIDAHIKKWRSVRATLAAKGTPPPVKEPVGDQTSTVH